jgi:hypothetical protein
MAELRASLILSLTGNLQARAQAAQRAVGAIGRTGTQQFRTLNAQVARQNSGLMAMGARYGRLAAGFAVGTVLVAGTRAAMKTEERLERLGVQAKRSSEDVRGMWDRINEVSAAPDINVDPKQVLGAIEEIVEKTGDLAFAEANVQNLARAIQATGAEGGAIGGIAAELQKMGITAPKDVAEALDILNAQGKQGAFTLANLAALGPRVFAAYSASGRGGLAAVREMGATLQMIRMATGSSEMAATAFEAVMRTLQDADKIKMLESGGIKIFEDDGTTMRAVNEVMADIIRLTEGSAPMLSMVFEAEAMRAFLATAAGYKRTGGFGQLEKFLNVEAGGETAADAARIAKVASQVMGSALAQGAKKLEEGITPAMKAGAEFVRTAMEEGFGNAWARHVVAPVRTARERLQDPAARAEAEAEAERAGITLGPRGPEALMAAALRRLEAPRAGTAIPGATGGGNAHVEIEFRNAPSGTRARVTEAQGLTVDLDTGPLMPEAAR